MRKIVSMDEAIMREPLTQSYRMGLDIGHSYKLLFFSFFLVIPLPLFVFLRAGRFSCLLLRCLLSLLLQPGDTSTKDVRNDLIPKSNILYVLLEYCWLRFCNT